MRTTIPRRLVTLLAAPLLLGTLSAAAPVSGAHVLEADQITYKETFYSTAAQTNIVGVGWGYCDGDYIMSSGYQTPYVKYKFIAPCP